MKCFECGTTEDIQQHHVVPKVRGGTKTIPLCYSCHRKAHHRDDPGSMHHRQLTIEGIKKAVARGVKLGTANPEVFAQIHHKSVNANKRRGDATFFRLAPSITAAFDDGCKTGKDVAEYLNTRGVLTARGKYWTSQSIYRYVKRTKEER